jgi:hypothetical protein
MVTPKHSGIITGSSRAINAAIARRLSDGFDVVINYAGRSADGEVVGLDQVAQRQPTGGAGPSGRDDTLRRLGRPVDIAAVVSFLPGQHANTFGIIWPNSFGDIWHTFLADRFGAPG